MSLPAGWQQVQVGDVASDVSYGVTAKAQFDAEGMKFLRITDIQDGHVDWSSVPVCPYDDKHQKSLLSKGDIVFARTGGTVGKSHLITAAPDNAVYASYLIRVRASEAVLPEYLAAYFKTAEYWQQISEQQSGIGQPNINGSKLKTLTFPLAPLAEQTRIAQKLDEVLAQVDTLKARVDALPAIIKRFRQSVLAAAVSGKLTEEWRGGQDIDWQSATLSEVASHVVDCPHSTPKWTDTGKICVRTNVFNPFFLDLSNPQYVSEETYASRITRLKPLPEDILYSREGTIGIACQIPSEVELCMGQRMLLIRAGEQIDSKYLTMVLNSEHILSVVKKLTMGSTAPRINMKDIRAFDIPVPPNEEQTQIVQKVEALFTFADKLESQITEAQKRIDKLTQSIQAKAFRGELVPQNPDDEPAEQLLARIKARREAEALSKSAKKKTTHRKKSTA